MKILFLSLLLINQIFSADIEKILNEFKRNKEVPGIAAVVIQNGQPKLYLLGFADRESKRPVKPDTIFELASITKVFVTTLLAGEVLKKQIKLSDYAYQFMPQLKERPIQGFKKVTLLDLATHTASLPRMPPSEKGREFTHASIIQFLADWNPSYPIGSKYVYSNLSFGILGFVLANSTHTSLESLLRKEILAPLGMKHTGIEVPEYQNKLVATGYTLKGKPIGLTPVSAIPGGGALKSTIDDMTRFLLANMGLYGPPLLREAMQFAQAPRFKASDRLELGLGWQNFTSEQGTLIDKNGGLPGFSSYIGFDKERKFGVVILCNKAKTQVTNTGREILRALLTESKGVQEKENNPPQK